MKVSRLIPLAIASLPFMSLANPISAETVSTSEPALTTRSDDSTMCIKDGRSCDPKRQSLCCSGNCVWILFIGYTCGTSEDGEAPTVRDEHPHSHLHSHPHSHPPVKQTSTSSPASHSSLTANLSPGLPPQVNKKEVTVWTPWTTFHTFTASGGHPQASIAACIHDFKPCRQDKDCCSYLCAPTGCMPFGYFNDTVMTPEPALPSSMMTTRPALSPTFFPPLGPAILFAPQNEAETKPCKTNKHTCTHPSQCCSGKCEVGPSSDVGQCVGDAGLAAREKPNGGHHGPACTDYPCHSDEHCCKTHRCINNRCEAPTKFAS